MMVASSTVSAAGWVALATGVTGLLALAFIVLFYTVGQPFGTLNGICLGLAAILSALLAWLSRDQFQAQAPIAGQAAPIAAMAGALIVAAGAALVVSGIRGWFLAGLYMAVGYALIGLWLLVLNVSVRQTASWPQGLVVFGTVIGAIMALGLAAIPGILRGIDAPDTASWYVKYVGLAGSLGWLVLYPIWCVWLGRTLLLMTTR